MGKNIFCARLDKTSAKEKAFKMFKQTMRCYLPETLEELENEDGFYIEVVAEVEQIIL